MTDNAATVDRVVLERGIDVVVNKIIRAKTRVILVAPYVTGSTGAFLAEKIASRRDGVPDLDALLLTRMTERNVRDGMLSLSALRAFIEAGAKPYSLPSLHAKVIVVDDTWALVGSMNLTEKGFDGHNTELAVAMTGDRARRVAQTVDQWVGAASRINRSHLKSYRSFAPAHPVRSDPLVSPGKAVGKPRRAHPSGLLQAWEENRRDRDGIADELLAMCPKFGDVRRGSQSPVLPKGPRSRAYRLCTQLKPARGKPTSIHVREALREVLARHHRIDARAHAAWRLGRDLDGHSNAERAKTVRALKQAYAGKYRDPATAVRRAAHRRLAALGEAR